MELVVDIQKQLGAFHLDVSFSAGQGVTGVLGASGCGKSLTLKCIAGIERPDRGRITLNGRVLFDSRLRIDLPPQQRRVGYLFQSYALFPNLTVEQNIAAGVRDRSRRREESARLMAAFQLGECRGKYPRQISGGQQQRTALARILASQPQALLLDEPFSALDSYLKWQIEMDLLERLSQFQGPALFVTHSLEEISRQCRQVCVLDQGRSQPVQTVEQLFQAPATLSACRLSGCENLSPARKVPEGGLLAQDWGLVLETDRPFPPDFSHVGIRACHILPAPGPGPNRFLCRAVRQVEGRERTTLLLRPADSPAAVPLRMEWEKGRPLPLSPAGELWAELPGQQLLLLSR